MSSLFQVSADSVIRTTGGNVSVKRLMGTTIDVNTGGGDMLIGSLYGNGTDTPQLQNCSLFHTFIIRECSPQLADWYFSNVFVTSLSCILQIPLHIQV